VTAQHETESANGMRFALLPMPESDLCGRRRFIGTISAASRPFGQRRGMRVGLLSLAPFFDTASAQRLITEQPLKEGS
jgi:hypothetical protein